MNNRIRHRLGGSGSDVDADGANLTTMSEAMDIDSTPTPATDRKKSLAEARAERAARRKQRKEELAYLSKATTLNRTPTSESECASPTKPQNKPRRRKSDMKCDPSNVEKAEVEAGTQSEPAAIAEPVASAVQDPAPETDVPEPLSFFIDVKPTKAHAANTNTDGMNSNTTSAPASEMATSIAPSSVNGESQGPNRAARRRLMQIERQRKIIKKELGIAADSDERQAEVDVQLASWTARFDAKVANRAAKRQKVKDRNRRERNSFERQERKKKSREKQKKALNHGQKADTGKSLPS